MVVDIDDPKPYESHVDISMFIRTRQPDGFLFYLGSDPFKNDIHSNQGGESGVRSAKPQLFKPESNIDVETPSISNITCELSKGTLQVTIAQEDGKIDRFNLFSAKLSNGYRHFVRVIRQNNIMTVSVNDTITINQDFPVAPTFIIEKLYLGNSPSVANKYIADPESEIKNDLISDIFDDEATSTVEQNEQTQERIISSTTKSRSPAQSTSDLITESPNQSTISLQRTPATTRRNVDEATESNLFVETDRPKPLTTNSDILTTIEKRQGVGEEPENEVLARNANGDVLRSVRPPRLLEDPAKEFSTAPLQSNPSTSVQLTSPETSSVDTLSRGRREIAETSKQFFKGIIQDVQITNGDKQNIRIVELFTQEFIDTPDLELPLPVGPAQAHEVKQGEISDETCRINPCIHDGICHVTWNDYRCECQQGWIGRNCADKEYCFWNDCPGESTCVSLADGYECLTNATFDGITSSVVLRPENFPNSSYSSAVENTIKATFRSKYITSGTILHIVGNDNVYPDKFIRIAIQNEGISLEIPEGNKMLNSSLNQGVLSGDWQTVEISFAAAGGQTIKARLNNGEFKFITLESTIDFARFITTSNNIVLGASVNLDQIIANDNKDIYSSDGVDPNLDSVQIHSNLDKTTDFSNFFRGCIGEVRIAGVLLPFYESRWLNETNFPNKKKFLVDHLNNVVDTGCILCYERECENKGKCMNPEEKFECDCLPGFEDPLCGTNIDECSRGNLCENGVCIDGIANYTCECEEGWEGWL